MSVATHPPVKVLAIIGSGPTGLHAAARFAASGCKVVLIEESGTVAANVGKWDHVRLFSPWKYNISERLLGELEEAGMYPAGEASPAARLELTPTGAEYVSEYLVKIVELLKLKKNVDIFMGTRVEDVVREGMIKKDDLDGKVRAGRGFLLRVRSEREGERFISADYVIDASGCYGTPSHMGPGGGFVLGESSLGPERITYHIPDVLGKEAPLYASGTHLVVGAGYSAITTIKNLIELKQKYPATEVIWLTRATNNPYTVLKEDILPDRKALAQLGNSFTTRATEGVTHMSDVEILSFAIQSESNQLEVLVRSNKDAVQTTFSVDRVISNVGYKPDSSIYSELHVHQCWATDGPIKLAASLIAAGGGGGDCLKQSAPGPDLLKTEEPGFFILGMKSYGRSSLFIIKIGLEQIEQVASILVV